MAEKPQRAASGTLAAPPAPLEPLPEVRESPSRPIKRVLTTDLQIEEDEMKQSRKAVKEALRVLEYHDSTVRPWASAWTWVGLGWASRIAGQAGLEAAGAPGPIETCTCQSNLMHSTPHLDPQFHDQFTAARILTFVTLEHHRSRSVSSMSGLLGPAGVWYGAIG